MPNLLRKPPKITVTLPDIMLPGDRLIVRPPRASDGSDWIAARNRNRAWLEPFEPQWPDGELTLAHFDRRLRRQSADWQLGRIQPFLVFLRGGELIGGVAINNIARGAAQYATLGYWLDEARQGQGLMAEALRLVIGYGFARLKLHRFNAGCLPHNARSRRLLEKLGFREEGMAEKYLEINGAWQDHVLYGLPVERWAVEGQACPAAADSIAGSTPS